MGKITIKNGDGKNQEWKT